MKLNEKGIADLSIVLVVLVVGIVGVTSWYVIKKNNDKNSSQSSQSSQDSSTAGDDAQDEVQNNVQKENNETDASDESSGGTSNQAITVGKDRFKVSLFKGWNFRRCSDIDAIMALVPGGDGSLTCRDSDAKYPEDSWYKHGLIAISDGENAFSRPNGNVKGTFKLENGNTAETNTYKYNYASDPKSETKLLTVHEYIVRGKNRTVTAKFFEGHPLKNDFGISEDDGVIQKQLESVLSTLAVQ